MNPNKLKARIVELGITPDELAQNLGISRTAMYRKLKGVTEFKQSEIKRIVELLKLNDRAIREIFFQEKVS